MDLEFAANPGQTFSFQIELKGDWVIPLEAFDFHLEDLKLAIAHDATTGTTGSFTAVVLVAGADFSVKADHPQAGQGWEFTGQLDPGQTINLADALNDLMPSVITLPKELSDLKVSAAAISWDTQTKRFGLNGELDFQVTLGPRVFDVKASLDIVSTLDASTGQRTTTGKLVGQLQTGAETFELEYEFKPTEKTLRGSWQDTANPLGHESLAKAFGVAIPGLGDAPLPDLGLTRAAFEFDYDAKAGETFVISARSAKLGEAFFLLRKSPAGGWGFAFGVACLTTKPSELPEVGRYLGTRFDFLTVETAFFILASTPFQDFVMPGFPGLKDFPMQVNTGAAMGAVIDFAATAANANANANATPSDPNSPDANRQKISHLNTIVRQPKLLLELTLSTNPANIALTVDLKGAVCIPSKNGMALRLSDAAIVIKAEPLAVTLEGSVAFPLGAGRQIEATGRLTISISEAETSFEIKGDLGALLPAPMGFQGVYLTEIGVQLGVIFEPSEVEVGLQGKFVIGRQPPAPAPASGSNTLVSLAALPRDNEFAFIFGMIEEVPNPTLLSLYLAQVDMKTLVTALLNTPPPPLPDVLTDLKASEVLLYWCDAAMGVQLPDGTWAYPVFGFNATVDLWGFHAHAGLKVISSTGITGDLSLDPIVIRDPAGKHIFSATGSGKGTVLTPSQRPGLVGGVLDAHGDGQGRPPAYARSVPVRPGGPVVHFSTLASPYLDVDWRVVLLNTVAAQVKAEVTKSGFTFEMAYKVGDVFASTIQCALSKLTHLELHFSIKLNIALDVGPIHGINLGPLDLRNVDCATDLVVDVGSKFSLTIDARFDFEGRHYLMPQLKLTAAPASLEAIPGEVVNQIKREARGIFKDLVSEAERQLQLGADKAVQIGRDTEQEVQGLAGDAEREYDRIVKEGWTEADRIGRAAEADAHRLMTEADRVMEQASRDLQQIERTFAAAAAEADLHAKEIEQEAVRLGQEAVRGIAQAARGAANATANIAKKAGDAVKEAGKNTVHAIKHIF